MCGRYSLTTAAADLAKHFWLDHQPELFARYNIAPTQPVGVVFQDRDRDDVRFRNMHWGLIPAWAKDPAIGNRMINARSETVTSKSAYRAAVKYRRCLIPADGFYEWKRAASRKQPHRITLSDGGLFAFAGLWEHWQGESGEEIESCTILTTDPNELMARIHNRMPVILPRDDYRRWIDTETTDPKPLLPLLRALPSDRLRACPVSTAVNNPKNDGPACIEPQAEDGSLF